MSCGTWNDERYGRGFVNLHDEEKYYVTASGKRGGTCIEENGKKCAELMKRYKNEILFTGVLIKTDDEKMLIHFVIHNLKHDQIIDVANGRTRMVSMKGWCNSNKIMGLSKINFEKANRLLIEANTRAVQAGFEPVITLEDVLWKWGNTVHDELSKNKYRFL